MNGPKIVLHENCINMENSKVFMSLTITKDILINSANSNIFITI